MTAKIQVFTIAKVKPRSNFREYKFMQALINNEDNGHKYIQVLTENIAFQIIASFVLKGNNTEGTQRTTSTFAAKCCMGVWRHVGDFR